MSERPDAPRDLAETDANVSEEHGLAGDLGVSSERVGKVRGSAEPATHGTEATGVAAEETEGLPDPDPGHN